MNRRLLLGAGLLTPLLSALSVPAGAQSRARVALVIGNGAYRGGIPPLANPPRDARAVALSLERLSFQVELLLDADRAAMLAAFRRLGDRAAGAEAALLFYAGHAAEAAGRNILFPVSVSASRNSMDLMREAVAYDELSSALDGKARTTMIFLDSCRDNPLAGVAVPMPGGSGPQGSAAGTTRSVGVGLASVFSPTGTLVVYATAPGQVALDGAGQHSPFTAALLRHIETPDVEVRDMLTRVRRAVRESTGGQQVPWDNSSLDAPFFMRTAASANLSAGPTRRIIEEARAHGIPIPASVTELRFQRTGASGPAAQLIGSWSSGDQRWGGRSGRRNILIVLSVNESEGTADTIFAQSEYSQDPGVRSNREPPRLGAYYRRRSMALTRGTGMLEWVAPDGERIQIMPSAPHTITALLREPAGNAQRPGRNRDIIAQVQMRRID